MKKLAKARAKVAQLKKQKKLSIAKTKSLIKNKK